MVLVKWSVVKVVFILVTIMVNNKVCTLPFLEFADPQRAKDGKHKELEHDNC